MSLDDTRSGSGGQSASGSAGLSAQPGGKPRRFGRFEPIEKLGAGAFGAVWRARDPDRSEEVALKVLTNVTQQAAKRFEVEVEANRKLTHPNIVPVLEHGKIKGRPYLVMPFVSGSALTQRPNPSEGGLSLQEAVAVVRDVALAVHYAHGVGVLHRDIKPDNVLVDAAGKPWILDFGMAQAGPSRELTNTGDMVGTPEYMAPEQARGEGHRVDERCDVYALGATLYFLLAGRAPLVEASIHAQLAKVLFEVPDPPSAHQAGIPLELDAICLKCLEKSPERRYASGQELAQDLERWLMGEVTVAESQVLTALTPSTPQEPKEPNWRARILFAAGGVCGLALLSAFLLFGGKSAEREVEGSAALRATPSPSPSAAATPADRPAHAAIAQRVAELARQAGEQAERDPEAALQLLDRAVGLAPNDAEVRGARGALRLVRGDFAGAAADLRLVGELRAKDAQLHLLHGRALLGLGEAAQARAELEVVEESELESGTRRQLALAWSELELLEGQPAQALRRLNELLEQGADAAVYLLLGRAREAQGEHESAREAYTEAAALGAPSARAALERLLPEPEPSPSPGPVPGASPPEPAFSPLGESELSGLIQLGAPPLPVYRAPFRERWGARNALVEAKKRAQQAGVDPGAWTELGHALALRSRYAEALAAYDAALDRSPSHGEALCGRGALRLSQGETRAALQDLAAAARRSPEAEACRLLGLAHLRAGTAEEARSSVLRACQRMREGALWQVLGRIHEAAGRWGPAREAYAAACASRGGVSALLDRGRAWLHVGRLDRASADFEEVLARDAGSVAALRWRCLVRLRQGEARPALDDAELALGADPNQARSRFLRGALRLLVGDAAGAAEDLGAALGQESHLEWRALWGVALARSGASEEARPQLRAFLEAAPDHPISPRLRELEAFLAAGK